MLRAREAADKAEADRIERERVAEERRQADAKFIHDRDVTALTLKGSIGTHMSPNNGGLRGSTPVDTGLRELRTGERGDRSDRSDNAARDLQGPQAAWKQLHCAAALSGYAFAALAKPGPDYQEASFLAGQAGKAMAGEALGVECGKAPPMPARLGGAADLDRFKQTQQRMIERAIILTGRIQASEQARALTPDDRRIQDALRQQREYQASIAQRDELSIAVQKLINDGQAPKYDPKDAAAIRQEQQAKAELAKYANAFKQLEAGDTSAVLDLSISLGVASPPAGGGGGKTAPKPRVAAK